MKNSIAYLSEFIGTAALLMIVVGSGIMGENLSHGNTAVALFINSIATGAGLYVIINIFAPFSGAHFNPIVSLLGYIKKQLSLKHFFVYTLAQISGGLLGVFCTHLMFEKSVWQISTHVRSGPALWLSEAIAVMGLLATIESFVKNKPQEVPQAVGFYICAAYFFTSSTSFANPAVTLARAFSNTFAGIAPNNVLAFILAQLLGLCGYLLIKKAFTAKKLAAKKFIEA